MYDGKEKKPRKKKQSELEPYKDEIIKILSNPGIKIKSKYWYFKNERHLRCSYDNFKVYVKKNKYIITER